MKRHAAQILPFHLTSRLSTALASASFALSLTFVRPAVAQSALPKIIDPAIRPEPRIYRGSDGL